MTVNALLDTFSRWSATGKPLVLASVYETEGSTYSKVGAQMLINGEGDFQGMLSGGCLEGDLAARARAVLESGKPQAVTYDLGPDDEELWGLGVGCDGLMRIFLQPLLAGHGYEPFGTIAKALDGDTSQAAAIVIESCEGGPAPGSAMVTVDGDVSFSNLPESARGPVSAALGATLLEKKSAIRDVGLGDQTARCLLVHVSPPPAILVLGAGLDAEPLLGFARQLGWRVTVQDHRPAYIEAGNFDGAEEVMCVPVEELSESVDLARYAAAIVMSHHLVSDRAYLRQLSKTGMVYIGLLGPAHRRQRLLAEIGDAGERIKDRVHGPAGLQLGGRGPAPIALSIIAEMHQVLMADNQ